MANFPLTTDPKAESIDRLSLLRCKTSAIGIGLSDIPQKTQFGRKKIEDPLKKWDDEK
jgi:hypothetical protein